MQPGSGVAKVRCALSAVDHVVFGVHFQERALSPAATEAAPALCVAAVEATHPNAPPVALDGGHGRIAVAELVAAADGLLDLVALQVRDGRANQNSHRGKWDSDLVDAAHVAQAVLVALDGTGAAWVRTSEEEREGEQHAPRRARAAPHDHGRAALCAAVYALPTNSALIHELSSHVAPHGVELPRDEDPGVDGGARGGGGRGASSGRNAAADPVGPVAGGACVACP